MENLKNAVKKVIQPMETETIEYMLFMVNKKMDELEEDDAAATNLLFEMIENIRQLLVRGKSTSEIYNMYYDKLDMLSTYDTKKRMREMKALRDNLEKRLQRGGKQK